MYSLVKDSSFLSRSRRRRSERSSIEDNIKNISSSKHNADDAMTSSSLEESTYSSSSIPKMKSVSFSTVEIRDYRMTVGDNPGGKIGPPVSLGWKHNLTQIF
jgi:hypothetical protein